MSAGSADEKTEGEGRRRGRPSSSRDVQPSRREEQRFLLGLLATILLLGLVAPLITRSRYSGSADLHSALEVVGALFGLVAGTAMVACFYSLGSRFHLLVGLAFSSTERGPDPRFDVLPQSVRPAVAHLERSIPATYVTGRISWAVAAGRPVRIAAMGSEQGAVARDEMGCSLASPLRAADDRGLSGSPAAAGLPGSGDFAPGGSALRLILFAALVAMVQQYRQDGDLLVRWVALSVAVSMVGQVFMTFSRSLHDPFFDVGHVYKVLGYAIPLLGFSFYQTAVIAQRRKAEERSERLNAVLRAVRNVNQIIAREKSADGLFRGVCRSLVESRGYQCTCVILVDGAGNLTPAAATSLDENRLPCDKQVKPSCVRAYADRVLSQCGAVVIDDVASEFFDDPSAAVAPCHSAIGARLEHAAKVYGLMIAMLPEGQVVDREELDLLMRPRRTWASPSTAWKWRRTPSRTNNRSCWNARGWRPWSN